jgi:hypothetical protein
LQEAAVAEGFVFEIAERVGQPVAAERKPQDATGAAPLDQAQMILGKTALKLFRMQP